MLDSSYVPMMTFLCWVGKLLWMGAAFADAACLLILALMYAYQLWLKQEKERLEIERVNRLSQSEIQELHNQIKNIEAGLASVKLGKLTFGK